jgi:hypothetical protein
MRRLLVMCSIVAALMVAVWAVSAAQSKGANFAGTWSLDKAKSELPQQQADNIKSATWTVTQDDKQLTREQKIERAEGAGGGGGGGGRGMGILGGGPLSVKLDGTETTAEDQRGKSTTKAKWAGDGKILEITTVRSGEFQGNSFTITTTEHWELADGGKTLKVHRKIDTPRGPQESKWTLSKQ